MNEGKLIREIVPVHKGRRHLFFHMYGVEFVVLIEHPDQVTAWDRFVQERNELLTSGALSSRDGK